MNFEDDDDSLNDWLNLVDQDDNQALEQEMLDNARDYTLIAIDCHPTLSLRNMQVKDRNNPTSDQKINIAQLQNVIQAVVVFLRSQIISSPDSKYCVMFYNTNFTGQGANGVYQGDGIYVLPHPNTASPMHTLSKDYIRSLMDLENIVNFQQRVGITRYYEGTTQFSSVISTISQIYSGHAHAANVERRVMLFTALENPAMMPFYVCMRRYIVNKLRDAKATGEVAFRDSLRPIKLGQIKELCEQDQKSCESKLQQTGEGSLFVWLLYPLQSTFPDLFDPPKAVQARLDEWYQSQGKHVFSNTPAHAQGANSLNPSARMGMNDLQSHNASYNSTQPAMSLASSQFTATQSFQPSFGGSASQLASQQGNQIKQDHNQVVSLALGGQVPVSNNTNQPTSALQNQISLATGSFTVDAFMENFRLYQDDLPWIQDGLNSAAQTQAADPHSNQSTTGLTQGQIKAEVGTSSTIQNRSSIRLRKLKFDPKFFESLFPECDIQMHIQQYAQQLQELKELKQIKQYKKRAITTVPLLFPSNPYAPGLPSIASSYFIGLDVFPQFIETKIQASSDVKLAPLTKTPIQSKTLAVSKATAEELNPAEITHYYPLGSNELVFFGKPEVQAVKDFGPGSLKILGFKEHDGTFQSLLKQLEVGNNIQRPYLCYPSEAKYPGSSAAFGDFVQMLYTCNRYVVAQFIAKKRSIPRLVYLLPVLESVNYDAENELYEQASCTCLQLIFAPFYEDIRDVDSVNKYPEEVNDVSDNLVDGINNVLDAFCQSLAPPKYRELQQNDRFNIKSDPPNYYKLQLRQALLESLALGIPEHQHHDELQLPQSMSHVDAVVDELYNIIRSEYSDITDDLAKAVKKATAYAAASERRKAGASGLAADGDDVTTAVDKDADKADKAAAGKTAKAAAAKKRVAANREQLDAAESAIADADADEAAPAKPRGRGKKGPETQDVEGAGKKAPTKRGKAAVKKEVSSDEDRSEGENPKPTRGRKPAAVKTETAAKKKAQGKKKKDESSDNYGSSSSEDEVVAPVVTSRPTRARITRKFVVDSESE